MLPSLVGCASIASRCYFSDRHVDAGIVFDQGFRDPGVFLCLKMGKATSQCRERKETNWEENLTNGGGGAYLGESVKAIIVTASIQYEGRGQTDDGYDVPLADDSLIGPSQN
jgi:hypothetical protein